MLMEFALIMSQQFNSPPSYWLEMPVVEMTRWALVAQRLIERQNEAINRQPLRPGL